MQTGKDIHCTFVSWQRTKNNAQILRRIKQKRRVPLLKRGTPPVVKPKTCLWYFCGQMKKRIFGSQFSQRKARKNRHFRTKMAVFWSEWRDLNPRPHGPEPCALPTALHPDANSCFYNYSLYIINFFPSNVKRNNGFLPRISYFIKYIKRGSGDGAYQRILPRIPDKRPFRKAEPRQSKRTLA